MKFKKIITFLLVISLLSLSIVILPSLSAYAIDPEPIWPKAPINVIDPEPIWPDIPINVIDPEPIWP